jgi:PPOX class probable F420-dependent enzyme
MAPTIPSSHLDLLTGRTCAALTTVMPDGQPQTTVVWVDYDGTHLLVNTMKRFQKARNMQSNPRVTLLAYDPRDPDRYLEIRGRVTSMEEDTAHRHLDQLSMRYTGRAPYFGAVVPAELRKQENPVIFKVLPVRIVTEPA